MSRDLGRDVPDLEKLYARKLWADFSYPIFGVESPRFVPISPSSSDLFQFCAPCVREYARHKARAKTRTLYVRKAPSKDPTLQIQIL